MSLDIIFDYYLLKIYSVMVAVTSLIMADEVQKIL